MNKNRKIVCAAIACVALAGNAAAAPGGGHGANGNGAGGRGAGSHEDRADVPPVSSNRQSLPDADRGLDRAGERESDQGLDHSRASDQQTEHAPDHGVEHRNAHSLKPRRNTNGRKNAAD